MSFETLPAAEKTRWQVGYMRLTDAAPLIIAQELGFFRDLGLDVALRQEVSWANLRDKLASGDLDAAHMLAPLPAMSTLGVSGVRVHMLAGLVLSTNGNAITLHNSLLKHVQACFDIGGAVSIPQAMGQLAKERTAPFTFATVHAFSTHTLLLRRWFESAGLDPDVDVRTLVIPPSQMVDSLESGLIEGFCVGEPWNTIASRGGAGATIALGQDIWPDVAEKVLAVRADVHQACPHSHLRLRLALLRACAWLSRTQHQRDAAHILGAVEYLDLPEETLLPALSGEIEVIGQGFKPSLRALHSFFGPSVNRPDLHMALTMVQECVALLGQPLSAARLQSLVESTWRDDLYEQTQQWL
ncbi:MAG: CmpA/NrtA family ABC transporter substrate-binding protein [Pseudomonadota bacterium]